jgi:transcriptional regulator with XRE-family HTH domain
VDIKEFGEYLRKLREFKSLSTHELAELSGVSQSYISHVETARKTNVPSPDILKKLAEPLGVSYAELMVKAGHVSYEDWFHDKTAGDDPQYQEDLGDLFFADMLGFPSREKYLEWEVTRLKDCAIAVEFSDLKYNGHTLTAEDRQLIQRVLVALFPQYQ